MPINYNPSPSGGGGGGAPTDAQYVTLAVDATLTNERVLTAGDGLDLVDAGAGSTVTLSADLKANGGIVIEATELALDLGASSITGTLAVGDGGTGATSLTDHGVLIGSGTSAISVTAVGNAGEVLTSNGAGSDPTFQAAGGGAPVAATYVVVSLDGTLTQERVLTGTANQISLADGGANGNITLSTPQDIATTSSVTFGDATLSSASAVLDAQNTTDAASNQIAILRSGNRVTPTDNDEGYLSLFNDDSTGTQVEFARISWVATDVTNTTKDAAITFDVMVDNALTERLSVNQTNVSVTGDLDISGALTLGTVLSVAEGGTGASTLTDGGILLGSGVGAITVTAQPTNGQLLIGSTGVDPVLATLTQTANQVLVSNGAGTITLSTPQDIHTAATPTFSTLSLNANSNQIILDADDGSGFTTTITDSATAARTITLPDATDTLVGKATTDTFTNKTFDANGTGNSLSNVDVADLANGTDGELITWSATGAPTTVAVGTSGQVLTSNGVGAAPTFQAAPVASGNVVQVVRTTSATYSNLGTTNYNLDDTIPQNTEGNAITALDTTITPTNASNTLRITAHTLLSNSSTDVGMLLALFQDSTANALNSSMTITNDAYLNEVSLVYTMAAGTTSATTFKLRAGSRAGRSVHINGVASPAGRIFGGTVISRMEIEEIQA